MSENTHAHKQVRAGFHGAERQAFTRAVLADLEALEAIIRDRGFEQGIARIGAEQELFLVDSAYHPAPGALKVLAALSDPHFTTELGMFNLEMNADPQPLSGEGLGAMEEQLEALYSRVRAAARSHDLETVLTGVLPTIHKADLDLHNMVPNPRYLSLSEAMRTARGDDFNFSIQGAEEIVVRHESVMLEACCASFQVHLQVPEPERFCDYYNAAQILLAPVLAASCNSPVLFGRRLWNETRIALFEQSCDIRTPGLHLRDSFGRVSFGHDWLRGDVSQLFKENIARFRILVGTECDDQAPALWRAGQTPPLKALLLHNGTIYRWLRACYGISPSGKPHLRLELRVLPSGPTIADEVASAALWLGLMCEFMASGEDLTRRMSFDDARSNFYAAARDGLGARMSWLDGESVLAQLLLLERLLPRAAAGLARAGVPSALAERYLRVLERRVHGTQTGAHWAHKSLAQMHGTRGSRMTALVAATISRQNSGMPVADWPLAHLDERTSAAAPDLRVSQYMDTDFITVRADDSLELVARLMDWEGVRHLIVEDERGRVVGLVTRRRIERALADPTMEGARTAVERVMRRELITIQSVTAAREAIAVMRERKIGFLPVVQDGHVVATLSEPALVELLQRLQVCGTGR